MFKAVLKGRSGLGVGLLYGVWWACWSISFGRMGVILLRYPGGARKGAASVQWGRERERWKNECDYIFVMRNEVPQIDGRINASLSDPIHKNGICFWSVD